MLWSRTRPLTAPGVQTRESRTRGSQPPVRDLPHGSNHFDISGRNEDTEETFTGGTIKGVAVSVEKEQYLDLEKMAGAAFAID